jgi:hypothetical protein
MKRTIGKERRGAIHGTSTNPTKRTGRADGQGAQKKRGVTKVAGAETKPDKGIREVPGDNRSYAEPARRAVPVTSLQEVSEA